MAEPGPKSLRVDTLDVLRGVAVAGMLLVHVSGVADGSGGAFDVWRSTSDFLARGKFYTIFALLFGIGFGLQLNKDVPGRSTTGLFVRRLAALAVIMLGLQALFGTSLLYYAIWGLPLVLVRHLSSRRLVLVVVALLIWQSLTIATESAGLIRRIADWSDPGRRGPYVLSLFILGLLAVQNGLVHEPARHRAVLVRVAAWGILVAVVAFGLNLWWHPEFGSPALNTAARKGFGLVRTEWIGVTYAAGLTLFVARHGVPSGLSPFAAVGRMSLSNYALHLLIIRVLFAPWALALRPDWRLALPIALSIFGLQAWLSVWWLRRYARGPLEWLWRSLTEGRLLSLRLAAAASTSFEGRGAESGA